MAPQNPSTGSENGKRRKSESEIVNFRNYKPEQKSSRTDDEYLGTCALSRNSSLKVSSEIRTSLHLFHVHSVNRLLNQTLKQHLVNRGLRRQRSRNLMPKVLTRKRASERICGETSQIVLDGTHNCMAPSLPALSNKSIIKLHTKQYI